MEKVVRICFDASLAKTDIGIGINNLINQEKMNFRFNRTTNSSLTAEEMGLVCAMEYAFKSGFKRVHFFTDNKQLSINGIKEKYLKHFPFDYVELHWIPRELNKVADGLSKKDSQDTAIRRKHKKVKKSIFRNKFKKYSYMQKVEFLKSFKNQYNQGFLDLLEKGSKSDYVINHLEPSTNLLIKMAKTIFVGEEASYIC